MGTAGRPAARIGQGATSPLKADGDVHACACRTRSQLSRLFDPNSLGASLAYCVLPPRAVDRTSAASGYSTSRATSSRARWISHATAKHSTLVSAAALGLLLPVPSRSGRLAVSSPLRGEPLPVTAHCRGATSIAFFATGYTPRSVGPAGHLYTLLPSSSCGCAPLLRHPRVP